MGKFIGFLLITICMVIIIYNAYGIVQKIRERKGAKDATRADVENKTEDQPHDNE